MLLIFVFWCLFASIRIKLLFLAIQNCFLLWGLCSPCVWKALVYKRNESDWSCCSDVDRFVFLPCMFVITCSPSSYILSFLFLVVSAPGLMISIGYEGAHERYVTVAFSMQCGWRYCSSSGIRIEMGQTDVTVDGYRSAGHWWYHRTWLLCCLSQKLLTSFHRFSNVAPVCLLGGH